MGLKKKEIRRKSDEVEREGESKRETQRDTERKRWREAKKRGKIWGGGKSRLCQGRWLPLQGGESGLIGSSKFQSRLASV